MSKVVPILFLVILLGGVVYVARSGVIGKIFSVVQFFRFPTSTYSSVYPTSTYQAPRYPAPRPTPSQQPPPGNIPIINPADIPSGFKASDLSPFFKKIRIGSVYPGSTFSKGQVSLNANFTGAGAIDVTGWLFQARESGQYVPQAINIYDPSGLSAESDVYLKTGDFLNIYSSGSAIGKNLRLNKCLGYLENTNHFDPSLPMSCPYVDRRDVSSFSGACQDYVLSIGSCRLPDPNTLLPQNDYACKSYLDTLNYRGCFDKYHSDPDFLSHEIRAWAGSTFLDERHDRVLLLDKKGLLVDLYEY